MNLSDNAKVTILLCSHLAINNKEVKPFTTLEWNTLADKLLNSEIKEPANLTGMDAMDLKNKLNLKIEEAERITKLLSRGTNLAFSIDDLERKSIYIVTRSDKEYPYRLKKLLGKNAPSLLYYCGDLSLVNKEGIAIVGSRDIDAEGQRFAQRIAEKAVAEGYIIFSGGARGVDQISEKAALSAGGYCVSFLADSMTKKIKLKENRDSITKGRMLLLSAINPDAPFNVANAMNRNKFVYSLSRSAFVIASDCNKGGTWAGAIENIKHKWVNTYVWENLKYRGNLPLINRGACRIPPIEENTISDLINRTMELQPEQIDIFSVTSNASQQELCETKVDYEKKRSKTIYEAVLPLIIEYLTEPKTLDEISADLNIIKKQASEWLDKAIKENAVAKTKTPVKYYKHS